MIEEIIKIGSIMFASSFKMLFGVPLSLAAGYGILETLFLASLGGIIGVVVFTFFSQWLIQTVDRVTFFKRKSKVFSKRNRMIIRVRQRFGLMGLAFIAPNLTIPIGTFVLVKYFKNRRKIILYESLSVIFWAAVTILFFAPALSWIL